MFDIFLLILSFCLPSDFTLPLYWDNMAAGEALKKVTLQTSSADYRSVKEAFKRTVPKTVIKVCL